MNRIAARFRFAGRRSPGVWDPDADPVALFNVPDEFTQAHDVAAAHPDKVKELKTCSGEEAERYRVLPMLAPLSTFFGMPPPIPDQATFEFRGDVQNGLAGMIPRIYNRSYAITADLVVPEGGAESAIVAEADHLGGFSLYVKDGKLTHTYSISSPTCSERAKRVPCHGVLSVAQRRSARWSLLLGEESEISTRMDGAPVSDRRSDDRAAVVITGTSTGIGAATAVHLSERGFHVFAGVRREVDGETLQAKTAKPLTPLIIEVMDEKSISAALSTVANSVGDRGLAGLVNNAGIAKPAPLEFQPMADFRTQLEVNLFGPVAMIQAFLPLLRRGRGRIINVGSIGGMLVLPLNGAYSASKFGLRAISDALRLELRQWNIHVSLIEVAPVKSAIYGKTYAELDGLENTLGETGYALYEPQIAATRKSLEKAEADAGQALVIAKAVAHALTSDKPKTRYLAGHGGRVVQAVAVLPDRVRDRALARQLGLPKPE